MEITKINESESQLEGFTKRLECSVEYLDGQFEDIWVEIGGPNAGNVTNSVDPWVVMLLPVAFTLGEPIETSEAIDQTLLQNLRSLQEIWSFWYPKFSPIEITANTTNRFPSSVKNKRSTASFFSGGVDSFHILANCTGPSRVIDLSGLITVWGFDVPLSKPNEFSIVRNSCDDVAASLSLESNVVATNMRSTRFGRAKWGGLSHGCALSSVGLLFSPTYEKVLIGSTHQIPDFQPWGSHVITDPLCSSSVCQIVHFGATESRVDKTRSLINFDPARRHLRVCWKQQAAGNCGKCSKCVRTMSTLHLFGNLNEFRTFDSSKFSLNMLAEVVLRDKNDESFICEINNEAKILGDLAVHEAATVALSRYRREDRFRRLLKPILLPLNRLLRHAPYFWRFAK